jgi:hypothetical protein
MNDIMNTNEIIKTSSKKKTKDENMKIFKNKINNEYIFNNNFVLSKMEENKKIKENNIINELKKVIPHIDNDTMLQTYNTSISIHQSKMQGNGNFLEVILIEFLEKNNLSYKKQVSIDKQGIIIGLNKKKNVTIL